MSLNLHVVDAFTSRPFAGNPAAVCLLPAHRDAAWMQLARAMNLLTVNTPGEVKAYVRALLPKIAGHGGIRRENVREAIRRGIAKINIATATRQPYERLVNTSMKEARQAVYEAAVGIIRDELGLAGNLARLEATIQLES